MFSNLFFTLFLHFTVLITLQALSISSTHCHIDDENGLLAFKSGVISDPSEMLKSWEPNTDCCQWERVTCGQKTTNPNYKRVTELYFNGNAPQGTLIFSGRISPSLGNLKYLTSFELSDLTNLTGPFPEFLFNLPNLTFIAITNSKLYGRIPKSIGNLTNLVTLDLSRNQFTGNMPSSLAKLAHLQQLDLSNNRLSGGIPISFNRLKGLIVLNLSKNQFTGTLPEFSLDDTMISLNLSNNKFTGKIPKSLTSLRATYIDFSNNEFTGELPQFGLGFDWILRLNLSRNQFTGGVPEWYGTIQKISTLDLSHNKLNGSSFPQMKYSISLLDLSYNNFRFGNIPKWIGNVSMDYLGMAKCGIKIKLNDWKPIASYKNIDLSENEITGNPLQLLKSKVDLEGFWASKNKMKFDMIHMKVGKKLYLDLSNNLVYGAVPKVVWRLNELNVSYNHLCGKLPPTNFPVSSFVGNDCLCGDPLPPCKA